VNLDFKNVFSADASETVSQANTVEMFNAATDDTKSYTTYDQSDFYDDQRHYGASFFIKQCFTL